MKHPQSRAKVIAEESCLVQCYLYCGGYKTISDGQMLKMVSDAMDHNLVDDECTVLSAARLLNFFTSKKWYVEKKDITDIKGIIEPTPVLFSINGHTGHFVVVENGKIVFDPLIYSTCVTSGKPISARILKVL